MPKRRPLRIDAPPGSRIVIEIPHETAPPERALTVCESDVLELLSGGRTLSRADIVAELCNGPSAHGESTVDKALTRLVSESRLIRGKSGYAAGEPT